MTTKKLTRSTTDRWLGGVCGGIAEYTGWDVTLIRVLTLVLAIVGFGSVIVAYIAAWILMPKAGPTTIVPAPTPPSA